MTEMTVGAKTSRLAFRIALAMWAALLPVLPGPSFVIASAAAPDPCCCGSGCGDARCCLPEAPLPCASDNACSRCPKVSGSLVFLAPDEMDPQRFDSLALIRTDEQVRPDADLSPPEPPPQSAPLP